ncbi:MAG: hypothetical protein ACYSO4_01845 [Planctomycetota bacterium]
MKIQTVTASTAAASVSQPYLRFFFGTTVSSASSKPSNTRIFHGALKYNPPSKITVNSKINTHRTNAAHHPQNPCFFRGFASSYPISAAFSMIVPYL